MTLRADAKKTDRAKRSAAGVCAVAEDFAVTVQIVQFYNVINNFVEQYQIRLDMAVTQSGLVAPERVILIFFRHGQTIQKAI